jgi:hypothetical protein
MSMLETDKIDDEFMSIPVQLFHDIDPNPNVNSECQWFKVRSGSKEFEASASITRLCI